MMSATYSLPAQKLRSYVQFYGQRSITVRDPLLIHSVPARGAPLVEFIFGDPIQVLYTGAETKKVSPSVVLVGMLTGPHAQLHLEGTLRSFVIMFQPAGLRDLFDVCLRELTDSTYDARLVLGKAGTEMQQMLGECDSFESCVRAADAFLASRAPDHPRMDRSAMACKLINAQKGQVRIPELAAGLGTSQRQLERDFREAFGLPPKLYARIVRFQAAIDCKARSATKSWTDVAHEFGYYDQMHLVHDFRAFSAETPTENLRLLEAHFRQQIGLIQRSMRVRDPCLVPRFVI